MDPQDPFNLRRFHAKQGFTGGSKGDQKIALEQIQRGRKTGHYMWWICPQIHGLGSSSNSINYSIGSYAEAQAYYDDHRLWNNLVEVTHAVNVACRDLGITVDDIFRLPRVDAEKFQACITLFALIEEVYADPQYTFFRETATYHYGLRENWHQETIHILYQDPNYVAARNQQQEGQRQRAEEENPPDAPGEELRGPDSLNTNDRERWPMRAILASRIDGDGYLEYQADWRPGEVRDQRGDAFHRVEAFVPYPELIREFHAANLHQPGPPRGLQGWLDGADRGGEFLVPWDDMRP